MPYRPAQVLRYSDAPVGKSTSDDDASPVLKRIVEVAKPDPAQEGKIRELWHKHEDGRRELLAAAPARLSGPPFLDRHKLNELDFKFESQVLTQVLNPAQTVRLAQEIYPPKPR